MRITMTTMRTTTTTENPATKIMRKTITTMVMALAFFRLIQTRTLTKQVMMTTTKQVMTTTKQAMTSFKTIKNSVTMKVM